MTVSDFFKACENDNLNLAKKIYYEEGKINIHAIDDYVFRHACYNNYFEIANWLYSLGGVDIHAQNDYAFRYACFRGHFETAKWLHSFGGVNIHTTSDWAFKFACKYGYFEIVKWLIDLDYNYYYKYVVKNNITKCYKLIDDYIWDRRKYAIIG